MRIFRAIKRLLLLAALCICCTLIMTVLPFRNRDRGAQNDKGETTIVGWMIDRIAEGEIDLSDADSIRSAVGEGEEKFDIALSEENEERIVGFMQTLDTIEEGAGDFIERAGQMYQTYSGEFIEEANDAVNGAVRNAVKDAARSFFDSLIP